MTQWLPVALDLRDRSVVVIGSNAEAAERLQRFVEAGAEVTVVSTTPEAALKQLIETTGSRLVPRAFEPKDVEQAWLVVLTEQNSELAARVQQACTQVRVFFCAIDQPTYNSFAHMALARAGQLCVAITTNGRAPGLGRRLRQELQRLFEEANFSRFVDAVANQRAAATTSERPKLVRQLASTLRIEGSLLFDDPTTQSGTTPR